jgi:hypothetical protein
LALDFFVNVMPWIRYIPDWVPGTGWKNTVKEWRKEREKMVDTPFDYTKQQIVSASLYLSHRFVEANNPNRLKAQPPTRFSSHFSQNSRVKST